MPSALDDALRLADEASDVTQLVLQAVVLVHEALVLLKHRVLHRLPLLQAALPDAARLRVPLRRRVAEAPLVAPRPALVVRRVVALATAVLRSLILQVYKNNIYTFLNS